MPEQINASAITPIDGEYLIQIKEFDAAGKSTSFSVPVPRNISSTEASVMLRAAVLKRTTWSGKDFPTILHAVIYADRMGLDIMAGDVYTADGGRLSTTASAKIRHAMTSGKIAGYSVTITEGPTISIPYKSNGKDCTWVGKNLKAVVSVRVVGWEEPVVYETTLEEWFMGSNPNWRARPAYMLRRNALSKALEEVAPMGIEADEAPLPNETPALAGV
jgi:hypothetical protein